MGAINRRSLISGATATGMMALLDEAALATGSAALSKRSVQGLARLRNRLARKPFGALDTNFGQLTFASLWGFDAPFDYVRFHYANVLPSIVNFTGNFALSSAANDGYTPIGGSFVNTTFNAAMSEAAPGSPPGTAGSATAGTMPAAPASTPANAIMAWGASDWMPATPLPPTDGLLCWLMARTKLASPYTGPSVPYLPPYKAALGQRAVRTFYSGVDGVGSPASYTAPVEAPGNCLPTAVEVMSRQSGATLANVGDSLEAGLGTASGGNGYGGIVANMMTRPGLPVTWLDTGWSGQTTANYYANGKAVVDIFKPSIMILKTFSPNDNGQVPTAASVEAAIRDGLAFASYAQEQGTAVVFITAEPWGYTGATEAARTLHNAALRSMAAGGMPVIDADVALRDPANLNQLLPAYLSSLTPLHDNDAGQTAKAMAALPVVQQMLGLL